MYLNRDWESRHAPVLIFEDVVAVNFASFFDRNYGLTGTDQLIYEVHKVGKDKRFIFVCEDGVNPILSGVIEIIQSIITEFNLTPETCLIFCRDQLPIPNATQLVEDSVKMWVGTLWETIKNIPIYQAPFEKKFAIWFHRGTFYRLKVTQQLHTLYKDDSFISYQERGMLCDFPFRRYFKEDIEWANANTPIVYDQLFPSRVYTHEMIVGASRKPYDKYFMEIVVETDCVSNTWITEKTVKNLYIGKPFLLMSGAYSLAHIKDLGFKTFDTWFDESYDSITNNYDRFCKIQQEIDRIGSMSYDQINLMFGEMRSTLEFNRQQFIKLYRRNNDYNFGG